MCLLHAAQSLTGRKGPNRSVQVSSCVRPCAEQKHLRLTISPIWCVSYYLPPSVLKSASRQILRAIGIFYQKTRLMSICQETALSRPQISSFGAVLIPVRLLQILPDESPDIVITVFRHHFAMASFQSFIPPDRPLCPSGNACAGSVREAVPAFRANLQPAGDLQFFQRTREQL
jgi:hypothetical protein